MKHTTQVLPAAVAALFVASASVLAAAASSAPAAGVPTETITPIREVHRGQHVVLTGEVVRLRDSDEFVLRDDTGRIRVYIGWRNRMPVSPGDRVTVWGVADDDVVPGFRPEIYADAILLASGERIQLGRGHE